MTRPSENSYLDFLERQFAEEAFDDFVPQNLDVPAMSASAAGRWARAAQAIEPRSGLGVLFGVSQRDIRKASNFLRESPKFGPVAQFFRRTFDILSAVLLLAIIGPLMVAVTLAIRIDSRGPAIWGQTRIGVHGKPFQLLKFRTMHTGDTQSRATLADGLGVDGIPFKLRKRSGMTRIGRILWRYSLDELPQLLNVLFGDMSLVGPRPLLPREVERYDAYDGQRLLLKPGLTGLWQISGRAELTWKESLAIDVRYVQDWSVWLDLLILIRTFRMAYKWQ